MASISLPSWSCTTIQFSFLILSLWRLPSKQQHRRVKELKSNSQHGFTGSPREREERRQSHSAAIKSKWPLSSTSTSAKPHGHCVYLSPRSDMFFCRPPHRMAATAAVEVVAATNIVLWLPLPFTTATLANRTSSPPRPAAYLLIPRHYSAVIRDLMDSTFTCETNKPINSSSAEQQQWPGQQWTERQQQQ